MLLIQKFIGIFKIFSICLYTYPIDLGGCTGSNPKDWDQVKVNAIELVLSLLSIQLSFTNVFSFFEVRNSSLKFVEINDAKLVRSTVGRTCNQYMGSCAFSFWVAINWFDPQWGVTFSQDMGSVSTWLRNSWTLVRSTVERKFYPVHRIDGHQSSGRIE